VTTTTIRAYRERPITRGGQVEDVLIKFRVGPYRSSRPVRPMPEENKEGIANGTLTVHRCNFIPTPEEIEEGWRHTFLQDKNPWPENYRSEVWLVGQHPINAALIPPLKCSSNVRHTLTALPTLPELSLLPRCKPRPCVPLQPHPSPSRKIRRCCVDPLNSPPIADISAIVNHQT
jgi:hypothetical protein